MHSQVGLEYSYRWVRSDTGSTVIYGVGANLYNIAPGDYYVTVTDAILGCEYPPQLIVLGGYTPVRLNGVETANFVNLRGANPATSTATADYEFTLNCNGGSDGAFDLFATGGSGNLDITSLSPAGLVPLELEQQLAFQMFLPEIIYLGSLT